MKMRIIITGGTFDKHYDEIKGRLTFKGTHLPEILKRIRCTAPISLEINQLIDSLEMKDKNRKKILESCRNAKEKNIVITHGTDTMIETAKVLGTADLGKVIVLTGAMIPYAIAQSDAVFNLGCAISAAQLLDPGVYVAMNGQIFCWNNVRKNYNDGVFERIE